MHHFLERNYISYLIGSEERVVPAVARFCLSLSVLSSVEVCQELMI